MAVKVSNVDGHVHKSCAIKKKLQKKQEVDGAAKTEVA